MDVQIAAPPPQTSLGDAAAQIIANGAQPLQPPDGDPSAQTGTSAPTGSLAPTPAPGSSQPAPPPGGHADTTLAGPLKALFAPKAQDFSVTFRVEHNPNEIVTVLRDSTGREIAQFPPDILVKLAEFFQKLAGTVVDRKV